MVANLDVTAELKSTNHYGYSGITGRMVIIHKLLNMILFYSSLVSNLLFIIVHWPATRSNRNSQTNRT